MCSDFLGYLYFHQKYSGVIEGLTATTTTKTLSAHLFKSKYNVFNNYSMREDHKVRMSLFVYFLFSVSLHPSVSLCTSACVFSYACLCLSIFVCLSFSVYFFVSLCLLLSLSLYFGLSHSTSDIIPDMISIAISLSKWSPVLLLSSGNFQSRNAHPISIS